MNQVAISFGSDNPLVVAQWQAMLRGLRGLSAYEVAVKNGFVGTEAEWLESLHGGGSGGSGPAGLSAYQVAVKNGFVGTEAQWLASLEGRPGADSTVPGPPGLSAYAIAVKNGFVGSESDWEASLVGAPGQDAAGGGERSRSDRVLQGIISRAASTMANNRFKSAPLRDAPTMTPISAVEGTMTRMYSAKTGGQKPWNILGGTPEVDGVGVRGTAATYDAATGTKLGIVYWVDHLIDGNECNIVIEQGRQFRLMVEEDGCFKYVPDANITLTPGTGTQAYRIQFPNHTGPRVRRRFALESGFDQDKAIPGFSVNNAGRFVSIHVKKQDQITRPAKPYIRSVHIGDSNIMGVNGPRGASHSCVMAAHLGIDDHWVAGIHSNGALQSNINSPTWLGRRDDWRGPKPDILFFNLSWVDRQVVQQGGMSLAQAVVTIMGEFTLARTEFPQMPVLVLGLLWSMEGYASQPDILTFNQAFEDAIAAKNDPLLIYIGDRYPEAAITGMGRESQEQGVGNADIYFSPNDHYAEQGDGWVGIVEAQTALEKLTEAFYNPPTIEAVPRISPTSATVTGAVGQAVDRLVAAVSNATPSSVLGNAPPGTDFVIVGQQLRLRGTYSGTTGVGQAFPVVVKTVEGKDLAFTATVTVVAAPVATISPTSVTQNSTVGQSRNGQILAQVLNGTPTSIVSGTPPAGMEFALSGPNLLMSGSYTTAATNSITVVLATSAGNNVTFTLNDTVAAAAVASINPTSGTATGTVGTAMDVLLGKVSGGTPSGVSGTTPAGTEFVMVGQELRLQGRPTAASVANFTATVATPNGSPTFVMTAAITAVPSGGVVLADLKFNGTAGSNTYTNDAPAGSGKLTFVGTGASKLGDASVTKAIKSGTTAYAPVHNNYSGATLKANETTVLDGDFEMSFWAAQGTPVSERMNGALMAIGDYSGAGYIDMEIEGGDLVIYVHEGNGDGGVLARLENVNALFPFGTDPSGPATFFTLSRIGGQVRLSINGVLCAGPLPYSATITGQMCLLNVPGDSYHLPGGAMDNFKLTKGDAEYKTFPFTPPTT